MCLESVNQKTVWRVNPETCVESVSMKKIISRENLKILNQTCAWRVLTPNCFENVYTTCVWRVTTLRILNILG